MQYSIVAISEIASNFDFRIDAECYTPYHIEVERAVSKKNFNLVEDYAVSVINFGAYSLCNYIEFLDYGKPFLVTEDINDNVIETSRLHYISEEVHLLLHKSHCFKGQVLLTMAGAYLGQAAVFNEDFECSSNQAIAKITLKPNSINPYYLSTFLNCRYGQSQIERFRTGTGQPNLNLGLIKTIKIVEVSNHFQGTIDKGVNTALELRRESINIYEEAQTLLLSELGLTNWQPKHRLTFVKNYSDTEQAGRIDADYFQPFYEEVNNKLQSTGFVFAKDICSEINYGTVPTSPYSEDNSGVPYIKGLNLKNLRVDTEKLDYITNTDDLPNKVFTKEGDIIISQMGTVGNCGVVSREQENWVFASFTIRIRIADKSKYDPYFVALYIETIAKPYYLMRNIAQASVRQNTDLPTIKQMPISNLPFEKQQQISQKIIESFNLRKQSKHLLECAKQAVEVAIEQDEQTAIDYLERETQELNY